MDKKKSFISRSREWATKNKIFGSQAFLRYVMLSFVDQLNKVSSDVVFKGGNLLWIYIKTPRATVDLDLSTLSAKTHLETKSIIERACSNNSEEVLFSIKEFKNIENEEGLGAAVIIEYRIKEGAHNSFNMDIVYTLPIDFQEINSPVDGKKIKVASLENIIADKIMASQRFGSGNTRLKDFDDLWRLSQNNPSLKVEKLKTILKERKILPTLDKEWIGKQMNESWKSHRKRYKDLPESLEEVFKEVNVWLAKLLR